MSVVTPPPKSSATATATATGAKAVPTATAAVKTGPAHGSSIWVNDSKRTWAGWVSEIGANIVDSNGNAIDKHKTFEDLSRFVSATLLAAPCAYSTIWMVSDTFRDFVLFADAAMMGQQPYYYRRKVGRQEKEEGEEEEEEKDDDDNDNDALVSSAGTSTNTVLQTRLLWLHSSAWWVFSPYVGAFRVLVPYVAAKKRTSDDVRGFTSVMLTALAVSLESPMRRLLMGTLFHHEVAYSAWRDVWSTVFLFGGMWCNFKAGLLEKKISDGGGGGSGDGGGKEKGRKEASIMQRKKEKEKKESKSTASGKKNTSEDVAVAPTSPTCTATIDNVAEGGGGGDDHLPANSEATVTSTRSDQSESALNKHQELLSLLRVRGTIMLTATPTQELTFEIRAKDGDDDDDDDDRLVKTAAPKQVVLSSPEVLSSPHLWKQRRSALRYSVVGTVLWTSGVLNKYYSLYDLSSRSSSSLGGGGSWVGFTIDLLRYVPAVEAALFFVGVPNLGVSLFTEPFFQYWKGFSHDYANALTLAHYAPPLSMLLGVSLHFFSVDTLLKFGGAAAALSFSSGEKIKQLLNISFAK